MNFIFLRLHFNLFAYLLMTITAVVSMTFYFGSLKPVAEMDYIDAIGEGGITLMILIWIFFILASRPAGKVTNLLFTGLTFTHISMLLDFIDEFVRYPENWAWLTTVESLPAPVGMVIMSYALLLWHQEQNAINNQLRRTERFYREHSLSDHTTGLYSASYMKNQIKLELSSAKKASSTFALMMFDIRDFTNFNHHYGDKHGDMLLREVAQLIVMNIRDGDLACRYASDRFIVLLPKTGNTVATDIAQQTKAAIEHLAYKCDQTSQAVYPQIIACSQEYESWQNYQQILSDINQQITSAKITSTKSANPDLLSV